MHDVSSVPLTPDQIPPAVPVVERAPQHRLLRTLCGPVLALLVALLAFEPAEAKRMGGGKSFGSRSSQSGSYSKPVPPKDASSPSNPSTVQRQNSAQQGAAQPGGLGSRFGGLGGMLGGMLMGGLLGSLFFGGGMGGGFGILELLLLVGVGFMIFKFLRSRRAASPGRAGSQGGDRLAYAGAGADSVRSQPQAPTRDNSSDNGWGALRSEPAAALAPAASLLPAGMDEAEFLEGAKALFVRLQGSWDRRDLADIATFTSPEVLAEITRQAKEDPTPGQTELLLVDARVIESQREGAHTIISVFFDVLLREDATAERPEQVREVWHIRRDEAAARPEWILEGIQQLAV
ncbi:Tim44 domain-containing protein [Megalodesulfovibrio paquesii]